LFLTHELKGLIIIHGGPNQLVLLFSVISDMNFQSELRSAINGFLAGKHNFILLNVKSLQGLP